MLGNIFALHYIIIFGKSQVRNAQKVNGDDY